jgi:uncharacterized phage protein gp47/JayE
MSDIASMLANSQGSIHRIKRSFIADKADRADLFIAPIHVGASRKLPQGTTGASQRLLQGRGLMRLIMWR